MASRRNPRHVWYLLPIGMGLLVLAVGLAVIVPYEGVLQIVVRSAALLAYMVIFLSILTSVYMRQMVRYLGNPFVKVHHVMTIAALALIVVHPLSVSLRMGTLAVFVPVTTSWLAFLTNGGRVAFPLFWLGVLGALLRNRLGGWRTIHWLTYVAFMFATVHANLLAILFGSPFVRLASLAMAAVVAWVFVRKRLPRRRPTARGR